MKTLIADDDEITRMILSTALRKLGHEVAEAVNGQQAWEAWCGGEFPFVISDWMMPDLDGLEFCRRIRAEPRAEYTYIILLTARSGGKNYLEAMNAGADDFISKPCERQTFAARIHVAERILGLHAAVRAGQAGREDGAADRTAELATELRRRSEVFAQASQELRGPVDDLLGSARLLESATLSADQQQSVAQILTSGTRLLTMIERLVQTCQLGPEPAGLLHLSEVPGVGGEGRRAD